MNEGVYNIFKYKWEYINIQLKEGIEPSIHKYELYGLPLTYFSGFYCTKG